MEGGWKKVEEERDSGIEEDCACNELARGSDLLISYLFCQTVPFHFSQLLSGKTSSGLRSSFLFFPPYGFETPFAQVRSIKVREFLFARKSNPFAFRGNIIEKHCKRISIYAFVCFEMINM